MLRAKESAALIAQVLPYGNTSSSTGSPRLLAGIHTKGRFCELHRRSSSLVRLVIVLFITFGLPPSPILIHRPCFLPPLLSQLVSLISKPVLQKPRSQKEWKSGFSHLHLFYEEQPQNIF